MLKIEGLKVSFVTPVEAIPALKGVSFDVRPSSIVAVVGESGSGKSVTAQAIMGLLPRNARIEAGKILFTDQGKTTDLAKLDRASKAFLAIRGGRISMIFQEPMTSMSPLHRVGFQIEEMLRLHTDLKGKAVRGRVIDMLRLVRFPDPERGYKSYPFELSGGLRQRAMIAMALIARPALLIADEPTTALDVTVQAEVLGLIKDLQREFAMAVMLITHDMGVVANMADDVIVLYRGEVMEAGAREDIFKDPRHPYLKALLAAVPRISLDAVPRLKALGETQKSDAPVPIAVDAAAPIHVNGRAEGLNALSAVSPVGGPPLLAVEGLNKTYHLRGGMFGLGASAGVVRAVEEVSLSVKPGECLALVGESGCGKTTLSKMIIGALPADSGKILWREPDGKGGLAPAQDLKGLSRRKLAPFRQRMQYIFQDPFGALNPRMTVYQLVAEPLVVQGIGTPATRKEKVKQLLVRVGLDPRFLNRYPHSFSGGQRQRLGIARALALEPKLLILDEPVSALDVSTQAQVLNLLNDLRRELGLTYLFISHNLAVVNYVADRIAVMCRGRIVETGSRRAVLGRPDHPYTRALIASAPSPDLEHPLDFDAIRSGRMTDPAAWPAPFDDTESERARLVPIAEDHMVRRRGAVSEAKQVPAEKAAASAPA